VRVSELARRTGTTVRALRYYESAGLVVPRRLGNGYREYDPIAVRLVAQIRELTGLGLSVEQTRPFVESLASGRDEIDGCTAAVANYRSAITGLQDRIARLTTQRDALHARLDAAAGQVATTDPCDLAGARFPRLDCYGTDGKPVDLGAGRSLIFLFRCTGQIETDVRTGLLEIPGARGEGPSWLRDQHAELRSAGAGRVYGLAAQPPDYLRELGHRLAIPYPLIPDPQRALADALGLVPADRRLTFVVSDGVIEHVFHPIPAPATHALQVMRWLTRRRDAG
jgi:DNA-binding transcriptional MerR regulator